MKITVKLFANLRKGRFDRKRIECPEGTTIGEILGELGIPDEKSLIIFVNHRHADRDYMFKNDDKLSVFPLIAGG